MTEDEEVEEPPQRAPTLADVAAVASAWTVGVAVVALLAVAAARESFDNWRRDRRA